MFKIAIHRRVALNRFYEQNEIIFVTLHRIPNAKWIYISIVKTFALQLSNDSTWTLNTVALKFSLTHHSVVSIHIYHLLGFINYLNRLQFGVRCFIAHTMHCALMANSGRSSKRYHQWKSGNYQEHFRGSQLSLLRAHTYLKRTQMSESLTD